MSAAEAPESVEPDEIRARLLAAATLVFLREGYAGCRMQDVAAAAGLSTGAIYNRFRGKGALFAELLRPKTPDAMAEWLASEAGDSEMAAAVDRVMDRVLSGSANERDALMVEALIAAQRDGDAVRIAEDRVGAVEEIHRSMLEVVRLQGALTEGVDVEGAAALWTVLRLGLGVLRRSDAGRPDLGPDAVRSLVQLLSNAPRSSDAAAG